MDAPLYTTILEHGFIDYLNKQADLVIQVDRRTNDDKYDFITEYISKNNLMISSISLLFNEHKHWDDIIEIYDEDPKGVMEKLTAELCKVFDKKFVLNEVIIGEEYRIDFEMRKICIAMVISSDVKKILEPSIVYFGKMKITLIPPIIHLINLCTKLYDPSEAAAWPKILDTIKRLYSIVGKNTLKLAGDTTDIADTGPISKIIYEFTSNSDYIFLDVPDSGVPSIISQKPIETDFKSISLFLKRSTQLVLTYSEQNMYLSNFGSMLKKHIIYNEKQLKRVPILYIYNNTSYELVNYTFASIGTYNFKIADPTTKLAFLFINIWEALVIKKIYNRNYSKYYIKDLFKSIYKAMDDIDIYDEKLNYFGVYVDKVIFKKTMSISDIQKFILYCYELMF
jgi:hypothetical protein